MAYDQATRLAAAYKTREPGQAGQGVVGQTGARSGLQPRAGRPPRLRQGVAAGRQESGGPRAPHAGLARSTRAPITPTAAARGGSGGIDSQPQHLAEIDRRRARGGLEEAAGVLPRRCARNCTTIPDCNSTRPSDSSFFSDIPAQLHQSWYLPNMDADVRQLCLAYGLKPTANIWKGKATIIAFATEENFQQFERGLLSRRVTASRDWSIPTKTAPC